MKTDAQVRQKIKQVLFRHRKRFVREGLAKAPANCVHNSEVRMPRPLGDGVVRICRFVDQDGSWNNVVCDPSFGGARQVATCPHYACRNTSVSLKEDFRLRWESGPVPIGAVAKEFPDLAALMWAMAPEPPGEDILTLFGTGSEDAD